jgi:hypothetical protein
MLMRTNPAGIMAVIAEAILVVSHRIGKQKTFPDLFYIH